MKLKINTNRRWFTMTKPLFERIVTNEGEVPKCAHCGRKLVPGVKVMSKARPRKYKVAHPKRYCGKCRRLLGIWIRR